MDIKPHLKKVFVILFIIFLLLLGFLWYDSKEPFVKPLFIRQINKGCPYYKDFLSRVYYKNISYPSSFFIIFNSSEKVGYYWHQVKGISNQNFKIEKVLPRIDPATGKEILEDTKSVDSRETQNVCIASDGQNVIYNNYVFPNADIESFEVLGKFYYKDKNIVYYSNGKIVPEADPKSFEIMTTDKGCIPDTESMYARDAVRIFYANSIIKEADRATFELVCQEGGYNAIPRDKNHVYSGREIK